MSKRDPKPHRNGFRSHPGGDGSGKAARTLIVIGGHEDKQGETAILREVVRRLGPGGKLVVTTVASHEPEGYFEEYRRVFTDLGAGEIVNLEIRSRAEALDPERLALLDDAAGVFFTGGD